MRQLFFFLQIFILLFACHSLALAEEDEPITLETKVNDLNAGSFRAKLAAIEALAQLDDPRVLPILKGMGEGDLYVIDESDTLVIAKKEGESYSIVDALSGQSLGFKDKSELSKVRINNRIRRKIRPVVAILELSSKKEEIRFEAAKNLQKKPDKDMRSVLVDRIEVEKSKRVRESLQVSLALIDIYSDETLSRFEALDVLGESVEPEAVVVLRRLAEKDDEGNFEEENTKLAEAAVVKLKRVEGRLKILEFTKNFLFGVSLGGVLLLAAIGLAITFGVMGVINMAHGEMIMLGAYTTYAIQQLFPNMIDASLAFAIPAAFLVSGSMGILIERLVIRHLYGRPLDTLLATFGISLILQQAVRTFNSNNVPVKTPSWLAGSWDYNGALSLTYNRIYIIIFSLIVLAALALLLKKTLVGLQMRAVTQNRAMANSMGIRSSWVDALTFGLGSGIAGIAGVALSQLTNVGPNLGQQYIIDSFMVVVFGGVGNLLGTFFAAISLGVVNKFLEPFSGAVLGKIIVLVFIILFIQWRPRGLFALKGRFVED